MIAPLVARSRSWGVRSKSGWWRSRTAAWRTRLRRGLRQGASLPLVLVTTARYEPWTAKHLDPLLEAIDKSDHVVGRRSDLPAGGFKSFVAWLIRRLVFAVPLDDVHSPCRLHRLEKLAAITLQSGSSFLDVEILAKATFLGHLIDQVDVPPLPADIWNEGSWADGGRVFKHPEFEVQSHPPEVAQGQGEGDDGPRGQDQHGAAHVVEGGAFENHLRRARTNWVRGNALM